MKIHLANDAESVRKQAGRTVHGMSEGDFSALHERMNSFLPQITRSDPVDQRRRQFQADLPAGASWDSRVGASRSANCWGNYPGGMGPSTQGGGSMTTLQRPYQPEFSSSDRQNYPVHRILANRYWRLFYKMDPVIGTGIDMYAEMPWGDMQITGESVEGDVRDTFETMWETCGIYNILPALVREYLIVGEVVPHCMFDDAAGIWTHVAMHNPDNLEVIDAPLLNMSPVVEFVPDDRLRQVLTSPDPELQQVRKTLPTELLSRLYSRQNIRLNTDLNVTFIPRKLHPYETRGTSLLSRMWRVLMLEDAIFEATIATARRHAGPLKIAKLGNAATNWIPGPEHERRFMELVAQAELDPLSWIVYHYGLQLEAFGTTDRVMSVNREWDTVERIKLVAMGISKSFLTGELTFASATAGLQVFLRRLLALRNFFVNAWIIPKFFKPISLINKMVRPSAAETSHRVRVRRSPREILDDQRLIIPKLNWAAKLNPSVDKDLLDAYKKLEEMGFRISKTTKGAAASLGYEDETRRAIEEDKAETKIRDEYGKADEKADPKEVQKIIDNTDPERKEQLEKQNPKQQPQTSPGGAPPPNPRMQKSSELANDLKDLLENGEAHGDFAGFNVETLKALLDTGNEDAAWDAIDDHLQRRDVLDSDIDEVQTHFRRLIAAKALYDELPDGGLTDATLDRLVDSYVNRDEG